MSLKHRNMIACILILLASVCWPLGKEWMDETGYGIATETTHPIMKNSTVFSAQDETIVTQESTQQNASYPDESDILSSQEFDNREETPHPNQNALSRHKTLGFVLCVTAAVSAVAALFLLWQQAPWAGPDGICMLIGIAGTISCAIRNADPVSLPPAIAFFTLENALPSRILIGCILLVSLRELWGWLRAHVSASWFFLHRITKNCPLPQLSLSILAGWILLALAGVTYHLLWFDKYHRVHQVPFWSLAAATLCGIYCLWKYGSDLQHFQKQLTNYQQGAPIHVGNGAFAQTEEQLLTVQSQHEEAIRTAVTSERFKVELISNVSHDLRTPLTSILGYSELLQQETLSAEGKIHLQQLHQKAGYMNDLVESLFELTKVSSGVIEAKQEEIDLIRLLEQTIGLFDDQLVHAGLIVRRNYAADSIPILTDGARMHQVFANLLGNAIKYALTGTRIHLEVKETEHTYQIRLVNTASYEMDFHPEDILQRFVRGDKARSTQGSGLGLAIAQTYTDSVGGTFRIVVDGDQFNAIVELPKTEKSHSNVSKTEIGRNEPLNH